MNVAICIFMVCFSGVTLWAASLGTSPLQALMELRKPHTDQVPFTDQKNIFEHADVVPSSAALPSSAQMLAEKTVAPNELLESATPSNTVRDEFHRQESMEDLSTYGVLGYGANSNDDESSSKADLDLELLNPNSISSGALRKAEPAERL